MTNTTGLEEEERSLIEQAEQAPTRAPRQFGSARGLIEIGDDFDEPLGDFEELTS